MQQPTDLVLVLTTVPDRETGERIARQLVEERLIACANLIPGLASVYRWKDAVHSEPEVLVLMKSLRNAVQALSRRLPELHPYDVPEMVVLPVEAGLKAYCQWVENETSRGLK